MFKKIKSFFRKDKENAGIKWSLYARVWKEVGKPQWKWLLAGIVCTIIAASAEGFTITLVKQVVDEAFFAKNMESIFFVAAQIVGAYGLKGAFTYAKALTMSKAGLLAHARLQRRIYDHMTKMDISKFYGDGIGKNLNYFTVQANAVKSLVTDNIIKLVQNVATLIISLALMIWFAPQMCILLLFLAPAIMIPVFLIMRRKRRLSRESFGIANIVSQHLNQTLHGIKTIQAFASEETEADKFSIAVNKSVNNSYKNVQAGALQSPLLETLISVGLAGAMIAGGHFIVTGAISTGDLVAFLLALTAAYAPVKSITGTGNTIQHGLLAAEVLFDFLDSEPSIKDTKNARELKPGKLSVAFENVSFEYNAGEPVLNNINLDVPAGKVCALVGPSGGGKTTLFNLLERFYEPQKGKVTINNTDIKKYTLQSLRKNIAEVSQDVFLFNGTIADNIKYGAPGATRAQIEAAARAANAHDFIMSFPKKYNNSVGERGALLSGGQKQRIAIARAILKDAPILLLDEATSALDTQSEKLIQAALKDLMKGRTTFVIAHRLSTILDSDIICVIKDGQIIEQGTDKELCTLDGEYKRLRDIQYTDKKDKKKK